DRALDEDTREPGRRFRLADRIADDDVDARLAAQPGQHVLAVHLANDPTKPLSEDVRADQRSGPGAAISALRTDLRTSGSGHEGGQAWPGTRGSSSTATFSRKLSSRR